ncbi:tetratricopeptide repeat protein [Treponema sp. OMZ 840]|uniref:tetratricopeptide repeat protein n=1 Tax=Treponema sp. OMZ 840 TaxID=244313 RepID=UPI003D93DB16
MAETIQDGIALYRSGKYTDALTLFLSLPAPDIHTADEGADGFDLAYYIGLSYARLERYDEAILYLEQVVTGGTIAERVNQCRFALAVIYSLTGRTRLADFELQQLIDGGYKTAEVYSALAYVEWEKKKSSKTIEHYEKALELNPNSPTALNGLGYVLACLGKDLTRALSLCKRALDMYPESAAFLDSLGWVYYKLGLLAEAQNYIKKAKECGRENSEIEEHYNAVFNASAEADL